jgi:hypothetical protein
MAFEAKFYDPDQVVIDFGGVRLLGYADGEYITVEQMADAFSSVVGSDGEVARSKSNDRRAKVTVKLIQTSLSNAYLSGLLLADLDAPNGAGVAPFLMQDLQGTTLVSGSQCWITKYPDNSMDRTAKAREWVFEIANATRVEGGNG